MTNDPKAQWTGKTLKDSEDNKIGNVDEVYLDRTTDQPEFVATRTNMFGRALFIPIHQAVAQGDEVHLPFTKDFIKDSPKQKSNGELDAEHEAELRAYYNLDSSPGDQGSQGVSVQ